MEVGEASRQMECFCTIVVNGTACAALLHHDIPRYRRMASLHHRRCEGLSLLKVTILWRNVVSFVSAWWIGNDETVTMDVKILIVLLMTRRPQ
jgi:hypothetical protein